MQKFYRHFTKTPGCACVPNFARFLYKKKRASVDSCDVSVKKYYKISTKTDMYLVIIAYLNLLDINLLRLIKIIKLFFSFNAVLVILMMAWIMHLWICDESLNLNQPSSKRKGDRKCYFIMWTNWRKYLLTYISMYHILWYSFFLFIKSLGKSGGKKKTIDHWTAWWTHVVNKEDAIYWRMSKEQTSSNYINKNESPQKFHRYFNQCVQYVCNHK